MSMYSAALLSGTDLLRLGEAGDAEGSGAAKAEPVRSSDREGSEALAADTAGTG